MATNSTAAASQTTTWTTQDPSPLGALQKLPVELRLNIYEAVFESYDGVHDQRTRVKERKTFILPLLSASSAIQSEAVKSYKQRLDELEAGAKDGKRVVSEENMGDHAYIPVSNGLVSLLRLPSLDLKAWEVALKVMRLSELREVEVARMRSMGYLSE